MRAVRQGGPRLGLSADLETNCVRQLLRSWITFAEGMVSVTEIGASA